eukprot:s1542_g13.t1
MPSALAELAELEDWPPCHGSCLESSRTCCHVLAPPKSLIPRAKTTRCLRLEDCGARCLVQKTGIYDAALLDIVNKETSLHSLCCVNAMVFPAVGTGPQDAPPPAVVKEFHSYFWWMIFVMLISMAVLQVMTGDGFGMFFTIILSIIVYYMVSDGCSNMSMYCLLVFGLISGFEALFGLLTLFSVLGGRSSTSTLVKSRDKENIVYETQVSVHPFFDGRQGTKYNIQSGLLLALPIVMLLSAVMSWWSFKAYPSNLFGDGDEV